MRSPEQLALRSKSIKSSEALIFNYLHSKEQFLSAWNAAKIGVVISDRRLRYKALNHSAAEIHNLSINAHLGRPFHEILGNLTDKVAPLWETVFSTGRSLSNLQVCGKMPKRTQRGAWIVNLFPLKDKRDRVEQVGCFVTELSSTWVPICACSEEPGEMLDGEKQISQTVGTSPLIPLSQREKEIVGLLAIGKANREISPLLGISIRTVETHRARIMKKLGTKSLVHVVYYAILNRLVDVPA